MIAYLTSHIGGSCKKNKTRIPALLSTQNGLLSSLQKHWPDGAKVLILGADTAKINDSIRDIFAESFPMSGLSTSQMHLCDKRNEELVNMITGYDVLILPGGHVPTQNEFFKRIRLKEHIEEFHGIVIGISAGSMNSAETVYAQPELAGESTDKAYRRFLPGLGITKLMLLPHYQDIKYDMLDGKRLFEDITYPDSQGREFYALEDGSYVLIENGTTTVFGTAYRIKDGMISQICGEDKRVALPDEGVYF